MPKKSFEAAAKEAATGDDAEHAKLLAALKAEEMQAVGYDTSAEVAKHTEALDRYFGKPYGDEVDGRSKLTTREIYETVAWTLPDLLDIFAAGGRICDLESDDPEAESQIEERADYLNYVFFKDNQGVLILHDFIFDALMHPRAYADIDWDDNPAYAGWQEYENLNEMEAMALVQQGDTEIDHKSIEESEGIDEQTGQPVMLLKLRARKRLRDGCCKIEVVPPEDQFVAGRATSMAEARYKGRLLRWRRSVWQQQFPEKRQEIADYSANDESTAIDTDERRSARFDDGQASHGEFAAAASKAAEELVGRKEYIWYADPDSDEDAKLLRVYRLGDMILEVEEVDDDPFASTSSHRVPHRLQGLSIPEIMSDLQKLKTVLTRSLVDGTMQANVPRVAADKNTVNLDDLLNLDYGAITRTDGSPHDKIMPIVTPDLSAATLKALEWTNQIIEQRAGVTRHAQGMDPDSLNHTAKGIQMIQQAANAVKRLLARLIAVGVEEMMTKVDRTVMRHQKSPRNVKLGKNWTRVDPRSWSPAMRVQVSVGLGTGAKDVQLQFLQMIQQDQVAVVANYGPQNPSVTMRHLYNTACEKLRVMGYQSADKFFSEPINPDGSPWVPQAPPNPEAAKAQADIQIEQMKAQAAKEQTIIQAEKDMQVASAQQRDEMQRVQLDAQNNQITAANENAKIMMEAERTQMEHARDMARIQNEAAEAAMTLQLKSRELDIKERELAIKEQELTVRREEIAQNAMIEGARLDDAKQARKDESKKPKANGHG